MNIRTLLIATSVPVLLLILTVIIGLGIEFWRVNDWLDRCGDETSGKYIWNDKLRAEQCDRPG